LEGAFDSIWVRNGVSIGSVTITNKQEAILNNYLCDIVLFFDNQFKDETSLKKSLKIAETNIHQKLFIWPENINAKDVNEYIIKYGENPFNDENFLKKNTYSGVKALFKLKSIINK
jgi:hypothetical protein